MGITRGPSSGLAGAAGSAAMAWSTPPAAGSKVIVSFVCNDAVTVTSVADNGTTPAAWVQDAGYFPVGGQGAVYVYRADGITLPASGSFTVTATISSGASHVSGGGTAYTGAAPGGPSHTAAGSSTGTTVSAGPVTANSPGALYWASFVDSTGLNPETISAPGGGFTGQWTQDNGSTFWAGGGADLIAAGAPSAQTCTWTLGDSEHWNAVLLSYEALPSGVSFVPDDRSGFRKHLIW